ncbi:hypothetical protein GCM10029992_23020 [Glycomyces albus]
MSQRFRLDAPCPGHTEGRKAEAMTVGELSERSGVPIKALRHYADTGLVYTLGRSTGGYRLFDDDALWCLRWIATLRGLGLTIAEIREIARAHERGPIGTVLAERLAAARERTDERITELQRLRKRIDDFEARHRSELSDEGDPLMADNPRAPERRADVTRATRT